MNPVNVTADAEGFTCNAYLVEGETTTLVDAGAMPGVVEVVEEYVESLDRVVITHQHGDHIEQLGAVLDAFDAECYAYAEHPRRTHELAAGDTVQIGDHDHEVVYTPGHASDHVSFISEAALFSGDVIVYNDGAFEDGSFGRTDMQGQSRERLIQSLEDLLDSIPERVEGMYPGHGDPFVASEDETVEMVIERALERAKRREPKYPEE